MTESHDAARSSVEPSRVVEVERKYDVDADTPLPDWTGLPGVDEVSAGELRELDARYLDTGDAELSRAGVALRRRTGGPDEGWHIKGPREGDGRLEIGWPLGDADVVPSAVTETLARWTTGELLPLARIENSRTAFHLTGPDGVIAEFVDDHVRATDLRADVVREWREWEFELGPAAPADAAGREALFAAVERAVSAAGGREASSGSKLARALGF
ncbi:MULTISPECIES: CYTH domain-containing protein [unclassified Microbacterium]|uniref:CYTH domain-containing protein n=1 Tax=unclassified Microbacterium TaxID=2609290 RepID=UPI003445D7FF